MQTRATRYGVFLDDLRDAWALHPMWRAFAWDEVQNRYRRSRLGLAWIAVSYLLFVIGIGLFFGGFSRMDEGAFFAHVAIGYAIFTFVTAMLADGCQVFRQAKPWVRSMDLPYAVYVYKSVARGLFVFAVNGACAVIVLLIIGWRPSAAALLAVPALLVVMVTAVWVQYLLGLLAARFRDIGHLIGTLTRLLFFTTPILWVLEEREGAVRQIAMANPVTHFVEIVRAPLLGAPAPSASWAAVLVVSTLGIALTMFWVGREKDRLPFYL